MLCKILLCCVCNREFLPLLLESGSVAGAGDRKSDGKGQQV